LAITRVYILARELGVKSTSIIKKCQDEGLAQINNHMATISAGLAATIREWFSDGENITAVETTEKVNLEKVRVRKAKAKREAEQPDATQAQPIEPIVEAAEAQTAVVAEAPVIQAEEPVAPVVETPAEKQEPVPPPEPEPILPAGPMLEKPAPAKLSGPRVVRIEAPELPSTIHRPKSRARYDAPVTQPLMYTEREEEDDFAPGLTKDGKHPAKRHKERTFGRRRDEQDTDAVRKTKLLGQRRQKDIEERRARLDAATGEGLRLRPVRKIATRAHAGEAVPLVRPTKAVVSEPIVIKDLSAAMAVKSSDIISRLLQQGIMATANQTIGADVAELVAMEFGTELVIEHKTSLEDKIREEFDRREKTNVKKRPVVATMLGHVDHGKTSLLDRIRSANVAAGEAGGITQHVGAYQVAVGNRKVTFLDTPGHEAFTAMRARGANITDVVVLVVAADDGVMPQTIEAIHHAKAANVPVIVALNKVDLPGWDVNRIYAQLSEHELTPVEWGGQTEVVKTSAVTGQGIEDLVEHLDYVAELLDLKADDTIAATGWVVEARLSQQRGPVATLLIKEGVLNKSDVVLAGCAYGRVKALKDGFSKNVKTATSSMPVEITGLQSVPNAGDRFYVLGDINRAKAAAEQNQTHFREGALAKRTRITLDNLFSQIEAGNIKELNVIIKADVQGSVDVLTKYLSEMSTSEVKVKILHAAPGGITEGDVVLAEASNAIIIGFNVVADEHVARIAESKGVEIRFYNIIYRITEDLQKSMVGLLEPEEQERTVGRVVVRTTFKISKVGTIAGCYVSDGVVKKNGRIRLIRDNVVIRDNMSIETLRHFKDDASEVKAGLECGVKIARFDDIKTDDVFEVYEIIKVARTL